jgi:hypothetical protein
VETAVTNAAAAVAEGNLKPESAITFSKVDEVLHKIATFLPISDEMLEDWAQTQSYIDARLILFVKLAEEAQLLSGDGTGANLVGLLNRSGLSPTIAKGTARTPSAPVAYHGQRHGRGVPEITQIRVTSFLEPDAIVIDPYSWQNILLSKTTQGAYYANGPFADVQTQALWGKRVVVTPAMTTGTAIVGAFAQGGADLPQGRPRRSRPATATRTSSSATSRPSGPRSVWPSRSTVRRPSASSPPSSPERTPL